MRQVVLDTETTGLKQAKDTGLMTLAVLRSLIESSPVGITTSTSSLSVPSIKVPWKFTALPKNFWPISPSSRALRMNLWTLFGALN